MAVEIHRIHMSGSRKLFMNLPFRLHRNHPFWVPPLRSFERQYVNPKKNPHLAYSRIIRYLAVDGSKPVGRIMGIINERGNEYWKTRQARFCKFESVDDASVTRELLGAVERWAGEQGMREVVGPLGFSNQDPQGFLIDGFQERPSIGTICNFRYIPPLVEAAGYQKEVDYVTYKIPVPREIPATLQKIAERVEKRMSVRLVEYGTRKEALAALPECLRFMNQTYADIHGFIPLSEEIIGRTVRRYGHIIDPRFLKVVLNDRGEIAGFFFGVRDITEGFRRAGGRIFPLGYFQIILGQKRAGRLDLLLGAVREDYRGRGLDTLLGISMVRSARELGMTYADSHHELESNRLMRAEMEKVGGVVYKRHRVYRKSI